MPPIMPAVASNVMLSTIRPVRSFWVTSWAGLVRLVWKTRSTSPLPSEAGVRAVGPVLRIGPQVVGSQAGPLVDRRGEPVLQDLQARPVAGERFARPASPGGLSQRREQ